MSQIEKSMFNRAFFPISGSGGEFLAGRAF